MNNPYKIEGPALISFSGGRTSGYMLRQIMDAHSGTLPDDIHVVFANTGKEMPETLDFVQECSDRWNVPVVWLEWRDAPAPKKGEVDQRFEIVNHNSAARNGEPFKALIDKREYLPNPISRICTADLKVKTMQRFMKSTYPEAKTKDGWGNVVGLRYDEMHRVSRLHGDNDLRMGCECHYTPLADAKVTKLTVKDYWDAAEFDLRLENVNGVTPLGNCDLCYLKGASTIAGIIRDRPELAEWWAEAEAEARASKPGGAMFRKDRPSYRRMIEASHSQGDLLADMPDDNTIPCMCTD